MKKLSLLSLALLGVLFLSNCKKETKDGNGAGSTPSIEVSQDQKAVIFNMTATWCQYCPLGKTAVGNVLSKNPTKTAGIVAHESTSDLGTPYGDTLKAMFGGTGTPTMAVGNTKVPNYTDPTATEAAFVQGMNAILAKSTRVGIKVEKTTGSGSDVTIKVHSKWFTDPEIGTYSAAVFFTESGIVNRQKQLDGIYKTDEVHNYVLRKVVTPLTGVILDPAQVKKDAVISKEFKTNLSGFNMGKMECVVVVWRKYSSNGNNFLEFINADKIAL